MSGQPVESGTLAGGGESLSRHGGGFARRGFLVALAVAFAGVVTLAHRAGHPLQRSEAAAEAVNPGAPRQEVLAVLIASSTCAGSKVSGFHRAVHVIAEKLDREAEEQHLTPLLVGVSVDNSVEQGIKFLSGLGDFNEVIAGMYLRNLGVQQYISGPFPGPLIYPQILILTRTTQLRKGVMTFSNERVIERAVGADKIIALSQEKSLMRQEN